MRLPPSSPDVPFRREHRARIGPVLSVLNNGGWFVLLGILALLAVKFRNHLF